MSLVETLHRQKLERQLRFSQAAMRHMEAKAATPPAQVVKFVFNPPPPAPVEEPKPDDTWAQRQIERFKAPWFEITDGPKSFDAESRPPEVRAIIRAVGRHYLISVADILSDRRTQDLVKPRQVAMYLSKQLTNRSLPEIGQRFGGRDHTTVLHAVRKIAIQIGRDPALAEEVGALLKKCEAL